MNHPTPLTPFHRQVVDAVKKHGFFIVYVLAEEDAYPYAYTVGLWPKHPDMILTGLDQQSAYAVLSQMAQRIAIAGLRYEPGTSYTEVLAPPYKVEVRSVAADLANGHMKAAKWHANEPIVGLQAVWPDPEGNYPWDDDYDEDETPQPLLAI